MTSQEYPLLLEAKANIPELISHCGAKNPDSIRLIADRLKETQKWLGCRSTKDWTRYFYQYVNRLAHLYFLRELQGRDAFLVFVYFVNDTTHIPTSFQEWRGALQLQKKLISYSMISSGSHTPLLLPVSWIGKCLLKERGLFLTDFSKR